MGLTCNKRSGSSTFHHRIFTCTRYKFYWLTRKIEKAFQKITVPYTNDHGTLSTPGRCLTVDVQRSYQLWKGFVRLKENWCFFPGQDVLFLQFHHDYSTLLVSSSSFVLRDLFLFSIPRTYSTSYVYKKIKKWVEGWRWESWFQLNKPKGCVDCDYLSLSCCNGTFIYASHTKKETVLDDWS